MTRTRVQQVKLVGEVSSTMIANNEIVKFTVDDIVNRITRDQTSQEHRGGHQIPV